MHSKSKNNVEMIGLRILFITVACWMISLPCFAKRHIKLKRTWSSIERSLNPNPSVEAWIEDNGKELSLCFYRDLGQVNVMVMSLSGEVVYSKSVEMQSVVILLNSVSEGKYRLVITGIRSEVYGEFDIY